MIIENFQLKSNFLEIWNLISAIPNAWKLCIREYGSTLERAKSKQLTEILKATKPTKVAYQSLLQTRAKMLVAKCGLQNSPLYRELTVLSVVKIHMQQCIVMQFLLLAINFKQFNREKICLAIFFFILKLFTIVQNYSFTCRLSCNPRSFKRKMEKKNHRAIHSVVLSFSGL